LEKEGGGARRTPIIPAPHDSKGPEKGREGRCDHRGPQKQSVESIKSGGEGQDSVKKKKKT